MTITAEIRAIVERVKNLGPEWHHTASKLEDAARAAEDARADRLAFLENCLTQTTDRLAKLKEEIRTLPEQIAKWEAERAHLEASTAIGLMMGDAKGGDANAPRDPNDSGRRNVAPPSVGKAEGASDPFIPGLPPERLRKVWAEWEDEEGDVVTFKDEHYHWSNWRASMPIKRIHDHAWSGLKLKPLGTSWSEVEAMADAAEKPAEPKMLDLRELPVGTVCEATADISIVDTPHVIKQGQAFRIITVLREGPLPVEAQILGLGEWWLPALVPARVVKEGGEDE